jgi:4-alpha-glucanotransferase
MNVPGRERGNWRWRLEEGQLTDALAARVREATQAAGR